jgi:hypothetical protein
MEIWIVGRRAAHWPQVARAQGDSHARRAAKDSSLAWARTLSQKLGASALRPRELLPLLAVPLPEAAQLGVS